MYSNYFLDSDREDEEGIDLSLNLGKNNEDLLFIYNTDQQIEDKDKQPNGTNNEDFSRKSNLDNQIEDIEDIDNPLNWKNNEDFKGEDIQFKTIKDIENMNDGPMMAVRYVSEDKALDEINSLENKVTSNKTTDNTNLNEKDNHFNVPENVLNGKKRKNSFSNFKVKKQKEKNPQANNSSLAPEIKSFHTLFNTYFKYLVEEGNSFNVSVFDEKEGPNGYYISKDFTQSKLGAKAHSEKLNDKITKFIQENKLKKLKEKKDEKILKILNFTSRELIINFYSYIFENSDYFKENDTIKKINANFIRIRKYPLIGFENDSEDFKIGYFKYFFFK